MFVASRNSLILDDMHLVTQSQFVCEMHRKARLVQTKSMLAMALFGQIALVSLTLWELRPSILSEPLRVHSKTP